MTYIVRQTFEEIFDLLAPPISCLEGESTSKVVEAMNEKNAGSMVVVSETNQVMGIFTERDYITKIACNDKEDQLKKMAISEFMTFDVKTITPDFGLYEGLVLMREHNFRHLVIVDQRGVLLKVFSIKDALDLLIDDEK